MRIQIAISFEFGVLGFGFWVLGFGFWVLGFGFWKNSYTIIQAINKKGILVIPTQEGSLLK